MLNDIENNFHNHFQNLNEDDSTGLLGVKPGRTSRQAKLTL